MNNINTIYIENPYKNISVELMGQLKAFVYKKNAVEWAKQQGLKPYKIQPIETKWQKLYVFNMGRMQFLLK